jgi:hypothetical protein
MSSSDPDDDPFTLGQAPGNPYPVGTTNVMLTVTDIQGAMDICAATVTVTVGDAPLTVDVDLAGLTWGPPACSPGYDIVRGDVGALRASGGDFSTATAECLADNHAGTTFPYVATPSPGAASWFLVRRVITGGSGTYLGRPGSDQRRQIAASGNNCS